MATELDRALDNLTPNQRRFYRDWRPSSLVDDSIPVVSPELAVRLDAYAAQLQQDRRLEDEREAALVENAESILDVPRGRRREWLEAHGLFQRDETTRELTVAPGTASILFEELDAVDKLIATRTEETREERAARQKRFEVSAAWIDTRSPWEWELSFKDLFGWTRFRANLANVQGAAMWYRTSMLGKLEIGLAAFDSARELQQHIAAGWKRCALTPNLSARQADILTDLGTAYRAGDVPAAVADTRDAYVAKRLERVRLARAHRDLLEDSTVTSTLDTEVADYRAKLAALDEAIEDLRLGLLGVGFDPVYAR